MSDLNKTQKKRAAAIALKYLQQGLTMKQSVDNALAEMRGQKPRHQPPQKPTSS